MPSDSSIISFEKVLAEDNTKVMLDCVKIAHGEGIEVFQSENRNVITIIHKGFYYHVILEDIVNAVLMAKLDEDIKKLDTEVANAK